MPVQMQRGAGQVDSDSRNHAIARLSPSSRGTRGSQPSASRASVMSGWRTVGSSSGLGTYAMVDLGYNYRLDEMSAALGVVQVARLDEILAKRARVAGWRGVNSWQQS